jgi:GNAT superfamily N-acetyltransferase
VSARAQADPSTQLRPFAPSDIADCARIYLEARRHAFDWCPPEMFSLADFRADTLGERVTVAEAAGGVCGLVSVMPADGFIHLLMVDPVWHRQGIGSVLLDHATTVLGPRAWLKCQSANHGALAFYRARGWHVTPGGSNPIGPWSYVSRSGPISAFDGWRGE